MRILVVDDDPAQLMLSNIALKEIGGFEVILASRGKEAIERARQERPDVILMDLMLEDIDGPQIFAELRADAATGRIPVIFHTARSDPSEIRQLLELGAKGVIGKPFDPMQLAHEVRRILTGQH
jgi:two-component system, OmpR family, response regulator